MTITLTREEAQQVLDALEQVTKQMLSVRDELAERGARPITNTHYQKLWDSAFAAYTEYALPAAETLRARLAQPEQEKTMDALSELMNLRIEVETLRARLAQPEPEPVAWHDKIIGMEVSMDVSTGEDDEGNRIFGTVYEVLLPEDDATNETILAIAEDRNYTAPPQREWHGLTDEEIIEVWSDQYKTGLQLARAIESKLKGKNNG